MCSPLNRGGGGLFKDAHATCIDSLNFRYIALIIQLLRH